MSDDKKPTSPSSGSGGTPANCTTAPCPTCPADFTLSPCRIVKANGGRLSISASELPGFAAGSYAWTTASSKIRLSNDNTATVTVEGLATPSAGRDAEIITVTRTASGCPPIVKTVKVTVAKVTFSAAASQRYGYDNFDTPANTLDDHICIKKSDYTFLHVVIEGGAVGTDFDFVCEPAGICTAVAPAGNPTFDLRLNAEAHNKAETTLHARVKCPGAESFTHIQVHVYKQRVVEVVIAKFDKTVAGSNLRFATADYASHGPAANAKLKEGVVRYDITNYDAGNAVTPVNLAGGGSVVNYDIGNNGGADLAAIGAAMTGTGTKVRVAIIRDMKSVYYLSAATAVGATTLTVTAASTFYKVGESHPLDTGAARENVTIKTLAGNTITCDPLTKAHAAGAAMEFNAAGWGSDPILIIEGSASLAVAKWTVLHEVGHRDKGLNLRDIIDATDFMHFSQAWTDYRLRYCPRTKSYPAGTADTENQWETIPRD